MKINTVIIDDHKLVVQSYLQHFENHEEIAIIQTFLTVDEVLQLLPTIKNKVQVVLLDLKLHHHKGQDLIPYIKALAPHIQILILSTYEEPTTVAQCKYLGADGYMVKYCSYTELVQAICKIAQNQQVWPSDIPSTTLMKLQAYWAWISELKQHELEFIQHCNSEMTYAEIADLMQKSVRTIHNYRDELFRKFEVNSRLGLINKASSFNLLP